MLPKLQGKFGSTLKTANPHRNKWVFCYLPAVQERVKIVGETVNYWLVEHPAERVVKSACSTVPTTKAKAVRRVRNDRFTDDAIRETTPED